MDYGNQTNNYFAFALDWPRSDSTLAIKKASKHAVNNAGEIKTIICQTYGLKKLLCKHTVLQYKAEFQITSVPGLCISIVPQY